MTDQQILMWFLAMQATGVVSVALVVVKIGQTVLRRHEMRLSELVDERFRAQEGMQNRLLDHGEKLARAPTKDDLNRLHVRIDDVAGAIKRLEGESGAQSHTLHLIHEYLLQGGHK